MINYEAIDAITVIISFVGGILTKLFDIAVNRKIESQKLNTLNLPRVSTSTSDDAKKIRDELRVDIDSLREEVKEKSDEADRWRDKYYEELKNKNEENKSK